MAKELQDHQEQEHWSVIPQKMMPKGMQTMKSVWSMKRKRQVATGIIGKRIYVLTEAAK